METLIIVMALIAAGFALYVFVRFILPLAIFLAVAYGVCWFVGNGFEAGRQAVHHAHR